MSVVLSVYSKEAFKEILLPTINNSDYELTLRKRDFHLKEDLVLKLEVMDHHWKLCRNRHYRFFSNQMDAEDGALNHLMIVQILTDNGEDISLIAKEIDAILHAFDKYRLTDVSEITLGKSADNDISFENQGMVSRKHARLFQQNGKWFVENQGTNGTYLNGYRIDEVMELQFGDYVNIIGLHMVYLGELLAIDTKQLNPVINNRILKQWMLYEEATSKLKPKGVGGNAKVIYHSAPRSHERLRKETVEIEAPPQKNEQKKQSLFMTIGPSITMALPMMLGCILMIYAYGDNMQGRSSLFMYSGLIMSVSSAALGIFWALINIRQQKKESEGYEHFRTESYGKYLVEKTDEIRNLYEESVTQLKKNYTSAAACVRKEITGGELWNRNQAQEDFLTHRLGIGNIPFQIKLNVPKKKFLLYPDELSEKPEYIRENYETLYDVPVCLNLAKRNLIGVVGDKGKENALLVAKVLSAQVAANNCYTDVKLAFIYDGNASSDYQQWEFAKWLPHVWSEDHKTRFLADTKKTASDVYYELTKIFRIRMEQEQNHRDKGIPKPYYIVFISNLSTLEGEPFAKYVFDRDPKCGLTTILLAERLEELPNSCDFIIENTEHFSGMYENGEIEDEKQRIAFDQIENIDLEEFARKISRLQVLEMEEGGEIPESLTFFEMLGIQRPQDLPVSDYWVKNRIYDNIRGMIGEKAGGVPCYLDVHEKYHGPHGLVAGTTGSGKSETLQTYLLSLAINYSPDDIGFFIIDYKGGGMANLFDGLPHMVGQISNLSGNQVRRAMISIKSENRRRQRVFNENGVNNINHYTKLYKNGEATMPIPHLFIIIDEFAELKREEPEFMKELISVAQVGRSLGVHLILATQKPSGTVDDNIWSNSKFRLCLRVQDRQDSMDMLHKPDAAYITQAGRSYLQVGNDEVYELFQSGYSGAGYDEETTIANADIAKLIAINGKVDVTGNSIRQSQKKNSELLWLEKLIDVYEAAQNLVAGQMTDTETRSNEKPDFLECYYRILKERQIDYPESRFNTARLQDLFDLYEQADRTSGKSSIAEQIRDAAMLSGRRLPQAKERTQLDAVKDYLAKQAIENGYTHKLQLWLPVLRTQIYLKEFDGYYRQFYSVRQGWEYDSRGWSLEIVLGQVDDPENQSQMPLSFDLAKEGNAAICGSIVSGKSTLMQTMAFALIQTYSPEIVQLYAIDFSSKMMSAYEAAPHFGGVMYEDDTERIAKFFNMIERILDERKRLFRGGNYRQYVQVHGMCIPSIVIFIDNYGAFKEKTEEVYEEQVIRLSKEGVSQGIFLIVSGAGFSMTEITGRLGENLNTIFTLSLPDKYAYGDLLRNTQIEVMPENGIKGRGLVEYGGRILEYQAALALEAENDYERMEQIRTICERMRAEWTGTIAKQIPEIPEKPLWSEYVKADEIQQMFSEGNVLPVGYDEKSADYYGIPLSMVYCLAIHGSKRSGKSNFLKICALSAIESGGSLCVIDSPDGTLREYENQENITYCNNEQQIFDYFAGLLPAFKERNVRKQQLIAQSMEEFEIFEIMRDETEPIFIMISDLAWFVELIYDAELDMKGFLENILDKGELHNIYFVAEMPLEKRMDVSGMNIFEIFMSHQTGIHFGGKPGDNPMLTFDYLSYAEQAKTEKAGIGILPDELVEQGVSRIVVPIAK